MDIVTIIAIVCAAGIGFAIGYTLYKTALKKKCDGILKKAEEEAEVIKKNKLLEVKEKFLNKKSELEKEVAARNQKIQQTENKLKQREISLNQKQEELQRKKNETEAVKENLEAQLVVVDRKKEELDNLQAQEREKLEAISGLTVEEAKERLIESLKEEAKTEAASYINDIMDEAKMTANKEAKRIVIQSIQRVATETAIENSVTVFHIDSDEVKGRIIGREGRNIRALEAATGVEIVVDDTPEAIVLSAFDPVRREIARLALHQLVNDGRIHPARIEEVVAKVKKQVEEEVIETGKRTTIDLGIHGLHPELIRIIGKMKYRSSYGQNLLQHARETANLCAVMASELGLNPKKAKRAGLLHDIGKVPDEEPELPHALYGAKLAEKFKEKPDICNAIGAHHDEMEMNSLLAPIVQICDAISGARPGARREIVEAYIKRLVPLTIVWIVAITNAVNFIDGLDGLAVGVSTISTASLLVIALLVSDSNVAIILAALLGACLGFIPYNLNPAKIFMGDTGATFLGFILACLSVQGLFKFYAIISFAVPFLILGVPIFDICFAILRRLLKGQNPMKADRGHVHHRLIDMGFNQKQSVAIIYMLTGLLGLSAVVLTTSGEIRALVLIGSILLVAFIGFRLIFAKGMPETDHRAEEDEHPAEEFSEETEKPD